jgi:hypothetical protein
MASIIDNSRNQLDQTIRIFDSFYEFDLVVNTNEYDIIRGYFISVCSTRDIAENFTAFLFYIAQQTQLSALSLLDSIKGKSKLEMNRTMAYYMNGFKSKTSLYGISTIPQANLPVARNIVQ